MSETEMCVKINGSVASIRNVLIIFFRVIVLNDIFHGFINFLCKTQKLHKMFARNIRTNLYMDSLNVHFKRERIHTLKRGIFEVLLLYPWFSHINEMLHID